MGHVKGNMKEYEKLMHALDKDGNGVIDYSEFLTASINMHRLVT